MTTDTKPATITSIDATAAVDAATLDWLAEKLAPARTRALTVPSSEAIARIRDRVLNETAQRRSRKIAA